MKYSELRKQILSLLSQPPYKYNIPFLARKLGVDRTLIHRLIKPLIEKGVIHKEKYGGVSWISLRSKNIYYYMKHEVDTHLRKDNVKFTRVFFGSHSRGSFIIDVEFGAKIKVDLINIKRVFQTQRGVRKNDQKCNHDPLTFCVSPGKVLPNQLGSRLGAGAQKLGRICNQDNLTGLGYRGTRYSQRVKFPKRAHWARVQALRLLYHKKQLTLDDWLVLNKLFNAYLDDISSRVIILFNENEETTLWLPYRTRFSRSGLKRLLRRFNQVFGNANKFSYGVWLTLTVDPKKYGNIIEMRYELQKAWNRFMSWLQKRLGRRPQFIRVIEFTKSGLVHYHILLLGVRRIGDKKTEVTPELERIGFGKVNYMYTIVNRNGKWIPKKLIEAEKKNTDGADLPSNIYSYLKKYLTKAFLDLDMDSISVETKQVNPIVLYWSLNARFFTYSKAIKPEPEPRVSLGIYVFLGTGYILIPELLPLETDEPPWEFHIPFTFPPLYDPR